MNMTKVVIAFLVALVGVPSVSRAESYQLSGKSYEMTWPHGGWDGSMGFPGVYCAQAPTPGQAKIFIQSMFNGGSIYVGKIAYPDNILLAVAFSSIPKGRTAEEDVAKLLAGNKETQARAQAVKATFDVEERPSKLGTMIALRINNVESDTPNSGPFPLVKQLVVPNGASPISMSVHRLFARRSDRFEVAAMQILPVDARNEAGEHETLEHLTAMVDALTDSLQTCTQGLPPRPGQ